MTYASLVLPSPGSDLPPLGVGELALTSVDAASRAAILGARFPLPLCSEPPPPPMASLPNDVALRAELLAPHFSYLGLASGTGGWGPTLSRGRLTRSRMQHAPSTLLI